MSSLDDVLRGEVTDDATANAAADPAEANHTGETQQTDAAAGESQTAAPEAGNDAPPASEQEKHVPLSALEAERKGRQDWKEKAIRFEEQVNALRAQMEQTQRQPQPSQQPVEMTPEMQRLSDKLDISEMMAREKYADLDEKFEFFKAEVAKNPALHAEALRQKHPYDWMYKQAVKLQALAEIGDDPTAYQQSLKEKLKAELMAEIGQTQAAETQQPATQAAPVLPKSLATSRSAGPRSAPTWTGPTALNDILKR